MSRRHCHRCIQLLATRKVTWSQAAAEIDVIFVVQPKEQSPKMFFADGNFWYSRHRIYVIFISKILLLVAIFFILDRHFLKTYLAKFEPSTCSEQSANQKCNIAWQYCKVAHKRTTGFTVTSVNCQTLRVRCEKEAAKPMFIDSHLFSSTFRGLIFYKLRPEKQNAAQLTVME